MVYCSASVLGVDVQVTREDGAIIDVAGKINYSMVYCSAFVLGVDVQVTRKDDAIIDVAGKINYSMVYCSAFVLDVDRSQGKMIEFFLTGYAPNVMARMCSGCVMYVSLVNAVSAS